MQCSMFIDVHVTLLTEETSNTVSKSEATICLFVSWLPLSISYHHFSNILNFLKMPKIKHYQCNSFCTMYCNQTE